MIKYDTQCRHCGLDITLEQLPTGKWKVTNQNGSGHFELCKKQSWENLSAEDKALQLEIDRRDNPPIRIIGPKVTHVWNHFRLPPWDESLGEFRDYTFQEKMEGRVCVPVRC